jgi:glycosyltransferase involved in cell wall biosynthesis
MNRCKVKKISVVIPVFNEENNIKNLYEELGAALVKINKDYEIIFVDDCSIDSSLDILKGIYDKDNHIEIVSLLGNHGQTIALQAGFKMASGDIIIAMDGDGQHDPVYIPQFVAAIEEGYDMVSGWKSRDESRGALKFFVSKIAHRIIGGVTGVKMNYFGATMKAYRSDILKTFDLSGDLHRFMGALIYFKGIKIKEIPIEIRPRGKGVSNYSFSKIAKVALDLVLIKFLTRYSKTPFRIFGFLGVFFSTLGILGVSYIYALKYFFSQSAAQNVAGLVISAIFFIVGIQFVFFGLMAEMISRVYYTSNNKEFFSVKEHLKRK